MAKRKGKHRKHRKNAAEPNPRRRRRRKNEPNPRRRRRHHRRHNPSGMGAAKAVGGIIVGAGVGVGAEKGLEAMNVGSPMARGIGLGIGGLVLGGVIGLWAPVAGVAVGAGFATAGVTSALTGGGSASTAKALTARRKALKGVEDELGETAPGIADTEMDGLAAVTANDMGQMTEAEMGEMLKLEGLAAVVANDMASLGDMYGNEQLAELLTV